MNTAEPAAAFEAELMPLIDTALRLATAMRLDRQDAEDAVQEASLRAWRSRSNRRPGSDMRPWFLAIVANQCRETRRSRWASVLRLSSPPVDERADHRDNAAAMDVRNALRRLPYDVRVAVVLRYYLDLPLAEVAQISGCSIEAAKSRVRRGVDALSARVAGGGELT